MRSILKFVATSIQYILIGLIVFASILGVIGVMGMFFEFFGPIAGFAILGLVAVYFGKKTKRNE